MKQVIGLSLFLLILWSAAAAEITVPRLEMASRGRVDSGDFVLSSFLSADFALSGGYKYAFLLGFSLEIPDIANLNNQSLLGFRVAKATARDIFGLPLELSYFLGSGDDFCSGDEFSSRFGLSPFGTDFRGFFYFPEGIGGIATNQYNGIYGARGTGFSFALTKWDKFIPMLYFYQNFTDSEPNHVFNDENYYSGDLRLLFHHNWLRMETFGGASFNSSMETSLRGGLMLHLDAGNGTEFFAQAGIPGWITSEKFSIDNLFFLIEPRLRLNLLRVTVTFFYHPLEYLHVRTDDERGKADINIKFQYGNLDSGLTGGVETGGELKLDGSTDFVFCVSPFVSFISSGLRWDAKIRILPLEFNKPEKLFEFFIGVRTAF